MAIGARKQPLYDQLVDILSEKIDHEYRPRRSYAIRARAF